MMTYDTHLVLRFGEQLTELHNPEPKVARSVARHRVLAERGFALLLVLLTLT
jgi:hypothetical protein